MENFKLNLSELTPVAEADRVRGNWYVVADNLNQYGGISQWHSGRNRISPSDGDEGLKFDLWFAIPPGLPGFPKAELPKVGNEYEFDTHSYSGYRGTLIGFEFELKGGGATTKADNIRHIPKPVTLPLITIPSGTKSEQVAELKRLLDLLC